MERGWTRVRIRREPFTREDRTLRPTALRFHGLCAEDRRALGWRTAGGSAVGRRERAAGVRRAGVRLAPLGSGRPWILERSAGKRACWSPPRRSPQGRSDRSTTRKLTAGVRSALDHFTGVTHIGAARGLTTAPRAAVRTTTRTLHRTTPFHLVQTSQAECIQTPNGSRENARARHEDDLNEPKKV